MQPLYQMYDWAEHYNGYAARCRKLVIRITLRYLRLHNLKLDACKPYIPHKQAKTLYYTSKLLANVLFNWAAFWSAWNARICRDLASPNTLVPFCSLLTLKQVRMGPHLSLQCGQLKMEDRGRESYHFQKFLVRLMVNMGIFRYIWTKNSKFSYLSELAFKAFKW